MLTDPRLLAPIAATFCLLSPAAQAPNIRFEPTEPMIRLSISDAPALLAALPGLHLGRLFAEPEVASAIEVGRRNYTGRIRSWTSAVDRLLQLEPARGTIAILMQREIVELDWRDLLTAELIATRLPDTERSTVQTTLLLEPVAAAEGRLAQRFEQLAARLRGLAAGPAQAAKVQVGSDKVDGYPALVLKAAGEPEDYVFQPPGAWLLHLPGQFAGGEGAAEAAGKCVPVPPMPAGISLQIGMRGYLDLISGVRVANQEVQTMLRALGLDHVTALSWQLRPAGELLQDEISLLLDGKVGGVLAALLDSTAPLVDQPLPEHALLQLRCAFDVGALIAAVDELLTLADMDTLSEAGVAEDLKLAWTGGMAFGITRPAAGGFVPRLYASFGIVDAAAFGRLITRLQQLPGLQPKEVTYEGQPCVQLRIDGAPPVLQPSFCLQDGVAHFAESGLSLRALLKARGNGAAPALDVGSAPRPEGPGAVVPNFDLRFDGAAIHTALHELWLPLGGSLLAGGMNNVPLVPMAEMPDVEVVVPHLRPGRGVLRRAADRITLAMSGTAGGPEMHVLLTAHGPLLSGPMTGGWSWQGDALRYDLAELHLQALHAAFGSFRERTGKFPATLGELLQSGDLADAQMLVLPGDDRTEPVMHDGKELARTSFRYFADGQTMKPQGEEVVVRIATLHPIGWRSVVLDADGGVHDSWSGLGGLIVPQVAVPMRAAEAVEVEEAPPPPPPEPSDEPK